MSRDAFADIERETVADPTGRPVLRFVRTTRDGLSCADLVVAADGVSDQEVADTALAAFPGWAFSGTPAVGRLLLQRGATVMRHAHVMSRDLVTDPAEAGWAEEQPARQGLTVAPAPAQPRDYLELLEAAYPPGHPDQVPRSEEDRIAHDILPLLDGSLGPLLDASHVVLESTPAAPPRMVAVCLVNDFPNSGPWVTDVARLPEPAYAGLGSLLLRRAIAALTVEGWPTLGLAVTHGNPARRTYDRLGFVELLESMTVKLPDPVPLS